MKVFTILFCLFMGTAALASTPAYDMKIVIMKNNKILATPHLIVSENLTGKITENNKNNELLLSLSVTPSQDKMDPTKIMMDFKIDLKNEESNSKSEDYINLNPQIIAHENKKATMTIGSTNNTDEISISVIANKTQMN